MKTVLVFCLIGLCVVAQAQDGFGKRKLMKLFAVQGTLPDLRWSRKAPQLTFLHSTNRVGTYWEALSVTRYSENGRFAYTHSFDAMGHLRETRASFSLRKKGLLSYWRIQLSTARSRPLFVYTIR